MLETLKAGVRKVHGIWLSRSPGKDPDTERIRGLAGHMLELANEAKLQSLVGKVNHQGVVAKVGAFPYRRLEQIVDSNDANTLPIIALDGIQDPGNLGNIFRACHCLGAAGALAPQDRSVGVTAAVEKASSGATAHLPMVRVTNLVRSLEHLKETGYWIYGVEAGSGKSVYNTDFNGRTTFVLGSEDRGIRRLVTRACDSLIHIPMTGQVTSLNVSQACVVILSECARRRYKAS